MKRLVLVLDLIFMSANIECSELSFILFTRCTVDFFWHIWRYRCNEAYIELHCEEIERERDRSGERGRVTNMCREGTSTRYKLLEKTTHIFNTD